MIWTPLLSETKDWVFLLRPSVASTIYTQASKSLRYSYAHKLCSSVITCSFLLYSNPCIYWFYFSLLRLFNVLPHSVKTFDNTRQLTRGDVIFTQQGAVLTVKWSKTIQDRKSFATVSLPYLSWALLCSAQ